MIQLLDSLTSIVILLLLSLDILIVNENLDTKIGLSIKIFLGFNLFFNFAYMFLIYNLQ